MLPLWVTPAQAFIYTIGSKSVHGVTDVTWNTEVKRYMSLGLIIHIKTYFFLLLFLYISSVENYDDSWKYKTAWG